ncbi:NINE protein [Sandaracinus amylolyticus]|uniref:NINE protein n=1 Tax=Sandaracinus amylolyticus TaxID=927083 RepID=UPI00069E5BE4|nr:TM2 domain-containing protein [Sandaracinus amylolyticus]
MTTQRSSHGVLVGYALWLFGFLGAHRFYYGRRISGTVYLCTLGLLGVGWILDLFLMPLLARDAAERYHEGPYRYDVAWLLLTYGGVFGLHRFYVGKIWSGLLYLCTAGLLGAGIVYDFWTMNEQVSVANREWKS